MTICDESAFDSNQMSYVKNANANVEAHVFGDTFSETESDGVVYTLLITIRLN